MEGRSDNGDSFFKGVERATSDSPGAADTKSWCRGKSGRMESSCRIKYLITSSVPSTRIGRGRIQFPTMLFTTVCKSETRNTTSSSDRTTASLLQASKESDRSALPTVIFGKEIRRGRNLLSRARAFREHFNYLVSSSCLPSDCLLKYSFNS